MSERAVTFGLRPGTRAPTTSSSGKPSTSLFAPALSDGGPRGRAEDDRTFGALRAFPASLEGVGAASECRMASSSDDMVFVGGNGYAMRPVLVGLHLNIGVLAGLT